MSISPSVCIQVTSSVLSPQCCHEHPYPDLPVQWPREYIRPCTFSILLEIVQWISKVFPYILAKPCCRTLTFSQFGQKLMLTLTNLHFLILHTSENLICLSATWKYLFISYVHFPFGSFFFFFLKFFIYSGY